jgi:hypothetical protein
MPAHWPQAPDTALLHGPAGEFVERTAPHTEADPIALLAQFLVAFGAAAGRHVHYAVEATRHHLNEFVILVGPSGKGRKGSSWDHVDALLGRPTATSPSAASRPACPPARASSGRSATPSTTTTLAPATSAG